MRENLKKNFEEVKYGDEEFERRAAEIRETAAKIEEGLKDFDFHRVCPNCSEQVSEENIGTYDEGRYDTFDCEHCGEFSYVETYVRKTERIIEGESIEAVFPGAKFFPEHNEYNDQTTKLVRGEVDNERGKVVRIITQEEIDKMD